MSQKSPSAPVGDDQVADEARTAEHISSSVVSLPVHLPGYNVKGELGRGGMGIVYDAWQVEAKRDVALKTIRTGEFASALEIARFRYEAEVSASLDHPHVVPIYEVGERDGVIFYSMKLLRNGSLAYRLRCGPRLDPKESARLLVAVARAIQHAHERGVIHRDLKPGNVLLDEHDEPHVGDFGLARQIDAAHSIGPTGGVIGTPEYAAPEQVRGERLLTPAVDVYGLGAILYECLTGRPPFRGTNVLDTITRVQQDLVIKPRLLAPDVPADLEVICLRCLSKEPAERYASAESVAIALERFLHGESPHEVPPVLNRVWKAITRPPEVQGLITGPVLWYAAGMALATNGAVFLFGWFGAPLIWLWLVFLVDTARRLTLLFRYHARAPRSLITPQELNSAALQLGFTVAQWVMIGLATVATPGGLSAPCQDSFALLYPMIAVGAGLVCFAHGITHWGILYLFGLGLMLLALPMYVLPNWSPLIYGTFQSMTFVLSGLVLPRYLPPPLAFPPKVG